MTNNNPPLANFPEQSGKYKVVQFTRDDEQHLRFGIKPGVLGDHHEFIVDRFADEIGIDCIQIVGPEGRVQALPYNSPYQMVGAGWCNINQEARILKFSGRSRVYSLKINQNCLEKLMAEFPEWEYE